VQQAARRNLRVVLALCAVLAAMITLVSFSPPLYRMFCAATGLNGTTQRVAADTAKLSDRVITVRFSTDVAPGLPWRFMPEQKEVSLHLGEEKLVFFSAENRSDQPLVGHADFNVTPLKTGLYFNKVQCFCFNEERLGPHEKVDMPVQFFVDPALATDPSTSDVRTITLSYTFFRSRHPAGAEDLGRFLADAPPDAGRGKQDFAERCAACHALDRNGVGPMLGGVLGRPAGSRAGYAYSPALAHSGLDWTAQNLDRWLAGPAALVPGTKMPVKILDASSRRDIIAYLEQQRAGIAATQ
jgi:cytochrome c oxidase assembly protein subunit 11